MSFLQTNVSEKSSVQVAVRVRPINTREIDSDTIIDVNNNSVHIIDPSNKKKKNFNFDYAFDSDTSQETVFDNIGEKVVSGAFSGYNCCIFAYGMSGSGKSHSVLGSHKDPGLIPRICQALFDRQSNNNGISIGDAVITYKIELSYLEIYSEEVKDLLVKSHPAGGLKVRQHPELGPYVEGLSQVLVEDYTTIKKLIDSGNKERSIASTMLNDRSSRSHAICTLYFTQLIDEPSLGKTREVVSKVNLVDLAGSERVEVSGVTGINFKEAININKSLSTLGLVISKLASSSLKKTSKPPSVHKVKNSTYDRYSPTTTKVAHTKPLLHKSQSTRSPSTRSPQVRSPSAKSSDSKNTIIETQSITDHIPFRDSVLTWILKESLGGNSKTFMLATISPSEINYNESLSTLRYAYNAKQIVNTIKVNEDPSDKLIRVLKGEIEVLRAQLSMKGSDGTTSIIELKQLKEELMQREELIKEKDKSWEQKLNESKNINKDLAEKSQAEKAQLAFEYNKKLEEQRLEYEAKMRDLEQNIPSTIDKTTYEEEFAKKQAEFEKGRIIDTAVSLQEYYEKKIDSMRNICEVKINEIREECDRKISAQTERHRAKIESIQNNVQLTIEAIKTEAQCRINDITEQDSQKNNKELANMKILYAKIKEENAKLLSVNQQQSKQFANERMVLSRQIQQLQAKIHSLENVSDETLPMTLRVESQPLPE